MPSPATGTNCPSPEVPRFWLKSAPKNILGVRSIRPLSSTVGHCIVPQDLSVQSCTTTWLYAGRRPVHQLIRRWFCHHHHYVFYCFLENDGAKFKFDDNWPDLDQNAPATISQHFRLGLFFFLFFELVPWSRLIVSSEEAGICWETKAIVLVWVVFCFLHIRSWCTGHLNSRGHFCFGSYRQGGSCVHVVTLSSNVDPCPQENRVEDTFALVATLLCFLHNSGTLPVLTARLCVCADWMRIWFTLKLVHTQLVHTEAESCAGFQVHPFPLQVKHCFMISRGKSWNNVFVYDSACGTVYKSASVVVGCSSCSRSSGWNENNYVRFKLASRFLKHWYSVQLTKKSLKYWILATTSGLSLTNRYDGKV